MLLNLKNYFTKLLREHYRKKKLSFFKMKELIFKI